MFEQYPDSSATEGAFEPVAGAAIAGLGCNHLNLVPIASSSEPIISSFRVLRYLLRKSGSLIF